MLLPCTNWKFILTTSQLKLQFSLSINQTTSDLVGKRSEHGVHKLNWLNKEFENPSFHTFFLLLVIVFNKSHKVQCLIFIAIFWTFFQELRASLHKLNSLRADVPPRFLRPHFFSFNHSMSLLANSKVELRVESNTAKTSSVT